MTVQLHWPWVQLCDCAACRAVMRESINKVQRVGGKGDAGANAYTTLKRKNYVLGNFSCEGDQLVTFKIILQLQADDLLTNEQAGWWIENLRHKTKIMHANVQNSPSFFPPFFLNSPRTKMNGDMMNSPFFPLTWILHIYTSLSPESVRLHVVCMCVCPNSWAGLTEPEHHGWLLIIHPNNPYIT